LLILLACLSTHVVPLILSFVLPDKRQRKIARIVALVSISTGFLVVAGGVIYVRFVFFKEPPTLSELQRKFPGRRKDLEMILRMSNEDAPFSRIAADFLYRDALPGEAVAGEAFFGEFMRDDPKAGLPKERWDRYRTLYSRNDIKLGIQRNQAGDAFIMADSVGLLNRGHATGYVYCAGPVATDALRYEPCTSNRDADRHVYTGDGTEGFAFQKVADRWYVYDQGPD